MFARRFVTAAEKTDVTSPWTIEEWLCRGDIVDVSTEEPWAASATASRPARRRRVASGCGDRSAARMERFTHSRSITSPHFSTPIIGSATRNASACVGVPAALK